jgi:hypothetical protein
MEFMGSSLSGKWLFVVLLARRLSDGEYQQCCELDDKPHLMRFGQLLPKSIVDRRVGSPEIELIDVSGWHEYLCVSWTEVAIHPCQPSPRTRKTGV